VGPAAPILPTANNDPGRFKTLVSAAILKPHDTTSDRLSDFRGCRLGKWRASVTDPQIVNHPAFARLDEPHARVHDHGRRALTLAEQGSADYMGEIELMNRASHEVIAILDEIATSIRSA
ncbi:MAG: CZB domain-containing protein, partial [Actinomycetota bacterium]